MRGLLYRYKYAAALSGGGAWYNRTLVDASYITPLTNASLYPLVRRRGWA